MKQKALRKTITMLFLAVIVTTSLAACSSENEDGTTTVILPRFLCALFFGLIGNDNIGLAAGSDGRMARTEDGGATWTKVNTGIDYGINDVAFEPGGLIGVGVGEMGKTIRTEDGGLSWQEVVAGASNNLNAVAVRGMRYWAVGDAGAMYFSNDGGMSWAHQNSGTTENLNGVCFLHENNGTADLGWAVGDNGTIVGTTDGTTWQKWNTPVSVKYNGCFTDGLSFSLAWGNQGTFLESEDFGATFKPLIDIGTSKDILDFKLQPDTSLGFFTGIGVAVGDGFIQKTSFFGRPNTWISVVDEVQFSPFGLLKAVTFIPNGRVDAVGEEDVHFQSTDSGATFLKLKVSF